MKKTLFLLLLVFLASQVYANSITIESVTSSPSETQPGERVYINVRLENQGTKDIKDVEIGLDLTSADLPFIPVGSAAKKEIENDESESVEFIFMVSSNAKPDTYKIPIVVSYKDDNEILEEKSVIGLVVKALPFLEVAIEES